MAVVRYMIPSQRRYAATIRCLRRSVLITMPKLRVDE